MHLSYTIHSDAESVRGFRYLWAKRVRSFDPSQHCARCLVGSYEKAFGLRAPVNVAVDLQGYAPGEIVYLCGVSAPYRWERNAHLAVRVTGRAEDLAEVKLYTGDRIAVSGAVALPFTDEEARRGFPGRGSAFLTCRNFQFGAQAFAAEAV